MKVNIYETIEISDEQRVDLARVLDGDGAKKRQATRDEIKEYVWTHGASWDSHLITDSLGGEAQPVAADPDEDLLGDGDEDLLGDDDEDLLG